MTAMQMLVRQRTPEEQVRAYRDFMEALRPMQQAMADVLAAMPASHYVVHHDGHLEVRPIPWPAGLMEAHAEFVRVLARQYGFEVAP